MVEEENPLPTPYEVTAFHEASHAVAAVRLGIPFSRVSVSVYQCTARSGDTVGGLHLTPEYGMLLDARGPANAADRPKIENLVIVTLAGEAAKLCWRNDPATSYWHRLKVIMRSSRSWPVCSTQMSPTVMPSLNGKRLLPAS